MGALSDAYLEALKPKEVAKSWEIEGIEVVCKQSDYEMMEKIVQSMNSIPTGRETLNEMRKYETPLHLMDDMGTSAGCYYPGQNKIALNKSTGVDKMRGCLVHEARHLWQDHAGRGAYENQNLDYETTQMIYRATEADAQSQSYKACNEWAELGDEGPKKAFADRYTQIASGWEKEGIAGAYKGWYDDERITAAYENGYDIEPAIYALTHNQYQKGNFVHGTPSQVKAFCGGDKVPNFEEFVSSDYAKQIHKITQAILGVYNVGQASFGNNCDETVEKMPLRKLEENTADQMYSDKYITQTRENIAKKCSFAPREDKPIYMSILRTISAAEKVANADKKGEKDLDAEQDIQDEKLYLFMAKRIKIGLNPDGLDKFELPARVFDRLKTDSKSLYTYDIKYDVNDDAIDSIKKDMSKLNYKTIIERSSEEPKVQNAPKESLLQKSLKNIPERNDIKDCVAKYISKNRER